MLIPFVLSTCLAPNCLAQGPGGPVHAELHPTESDIYLEIGDVSGLLVELDKAPLVRFLRDERIAGLFAELGHPTNRSLKELVQDGLAGVLPDGKVDGWLPGLRTISASVVALGPGSDSTPPGALLVVVDFATPEQAGALQSVLVERASKHEPMSAALPGVECLHMGDEAAKDLWCVAIGSRLVVGDAPSKPEDYAARAGTKSAGLAGSERFQQQLAAFEKPSGTPVLWFSLAAPLPSLVAKMQEGEDAGLDLVEQLPSDLNPFGSACLARTQFVGERFITELISSGSASASSPIDPAWLEPVPAGSMVVYSGAFDGAAAARRLRELLAGSDELLASLTALEEKLGFAPERMLTHLGPGLTVYVAPLAGLGLPETRAWIDCDDAAAFTSDFEAVFNALADTLPGLQAKTKIYKVKKSGSEEKLEASYTTLTLPQSWQAIPMINPAPSFAPVGKKLVFGLGSMDVKNELKRVHAGDGEPIVAGARPLDAYGFQVPADARAIFVMDWAKLLGGIVGTVKGFAGMAGPEALPFDLAKLPSPELFGQYFKPTFFYSKSTAGGLYRRNEASFGPETWLGFGVLSMVVVPRIANASAGATDDVVPLTPGSDE